MISIKQGLSTLFVALLMLSACKNDFGVGLDVDPSKQVDLHTVDTATIRTTTVREDSVMVNGLSQHPFGYIDDPELGTTRSDLAMALSLSTISPDWGGKSSIDSAVLVLKYGTEFYGDSVNSTYRLDVHELGETYDQTKTYYNTKTWVGATPVVGGVTVPRYFIHKNVKETEPIKGAKDSVYNRGPHLRIPIDTAYIRSRFINAPDSTFATSEKFAAYLNGLFLTLNRSRSTGKGGLVTFNLASTDSCKLEIYYRNKSGTTIDTLTASFGVSSSATAASISRTYTAAVQTQLNNPTQQFTQTYVQPMAGLRTRVTFPYIDRLKSLGTILVNKAELVVQAVPSSLDPAPRLTLYRTDIAGTRTPVPDNNYGQKTGTPDSRYLTELDFGGFYETTNKRWVFNITSYVQDLIDGKLNQYNTYIAPVQVFSTRSSGSDLAPVANTVYRGILGGGNAAQYKMRLNITYTKVNQQ